MARLYRKVVGALIMTEKVMKQGLTARRIREERRTVGVLYRLVRGRMGLSQRDMGRLLGVSRDAIMQREKTKRTYSLEELVSLQQLTQFTDAEWWDMIKEVAKS